LKLAQDNQATLSAVTVVEGLKSHSTDAKRSIYEQLVANRREELDEFVRSATPNEVTVNTKVLTGRAFIEIIREVLQYERDLVIKSIEREDHRHLGFSATDRKLMRKCPCPVWLIKATQQTGYREILVGVAYEPDNPENDEMNRQLLEMSASLAIANFSELHVVHAWHLENESFLRGPRMVYTSIEIDAMVREEEAKHQQWLATTVANCCASLGQDAVDYLKPQLHVLKGSARVIVPQCAKDLGAELVVLGTVARTGIPGLLMGNTAEAVLDQIDCSVLALKPPGFISPVTLD
jgi:nucleotide-binding universal stress UspA family protein